MAETVPDWARADAAPPPPAASAAVPDWARDAAPKPAPPAPKPRTAGTIAQEVVTKPIMPAEGAKGIVENAMSMGSGALGMVAGGVAGATKLASRMIDHGLPTDADLQDAASTVQGVQGAMTYQPRSEAGQRQQEAVGTVLQAATGAVKDWLAAPVKTVTPAMPGKPLPLGMTPGQAMPPQDPTQEQHPALRAAAETILDTAVDQLPVAVPMLRGAGPAARAAAQVPHRLGSLASGGVEKLIDKSLPAPDPELLKSVTMATDKFPDLQVTPDRLQPRGASPAATRLQELSEAPGAGAPRHDYENRVVVTREAAKLFDPENTEGRLTPEAVGKGFDRAWKLVEKGYDEAGPQPGNVLAKKLQGEVENAERTGSDEAERIIPGHVTELLSKADPETGLISPAALREWDSRVGLEARGAVDPSLARRLSDLQDVVREHVEGQVSPATKFDMATGRKRYAIGIDLQPISRSQHTINHGIVEDSRAILKAITDDRRGKTLTSRGSGGALEDLAKAGDLVGSPAKGTPAAKAVPTGLYSRIEKVVKSGVGLTAGRAYNKAGPKVTKRIIDRNRPAPPPPPAPLTLAPPGTPLGGGGGGGAPVAPGPLGDLTPEWETSPGAAPGAIDEVVPGVHRDQSAAPPLDAAGLYEPLPAPELPQGTGPGREIPAVPGRPGEPEAFPAGPLGDTTPDWETSPGAAPPPDGHPTQVYPGIHELPREPLDAAGLYDDGAVTRKAPGQESPAAPPEAPPEPSRLSDTEQKALAHLDDEIAQAKSPAVKAALQKARADVQRGASSRIKTEDNKAAAVELRAAAARAPTPELAKSLTTQADKLDPPPKPPAAPKAPPAPPTPKPPTPPKPPKAPPPAPPPAPKPPPPPAPAPAAAAATPEPVVADADAEAAAVRDAQAAAEAADAAPASPPEGVDVAGPGPSAVAAPDPVPLPEMPAEEAAPKTPKPMLATPEGTRLATPERTAISTWNRYRKAAAEAKAAGDTEGAARLSKIAEENYQLAQRLQDETIAAKKAQATKDKRAATIAAKKATPMLKPKDAK